MQAVGLVLDHLSGLAHLHLFAGVVKDVVALSIRPHIFKAAGVQLEFARRFQLFFFLLFFWVLLQYLALLALVLLAAGETGE